MHCAINDLQQFLSWPQWKLDFHVAHSILKMEGSKRCQNGRTSCMFPLPPFEGVYLLIWPTNLRHQAVFKAKNNIRELYYTFCKM